MSGHFQSKANSVFDVTGKDGSPKDIVEAIRDFTFRSRPKERQETLLPTLPNLYGLDVRFKYTERMIKAEQDRKRVTSQKKTTIQGLSSAKLDMAYANSPPTNRHGRVAKDHYTINYISPVSYKLKFRNKGFYNTAQNDPANATGVSQKSLASLASKHSTMERDDQDRTRNGMQQNMTAQPNGQLTFADDLNDDNEIQKGTPNNQRISKMSRPTPAEPADKDKPMSIQEHIDAYYAGLEQLDLKMKKKREEMRMRAFDSAEFDQGGA